MQHHEDCWPTSDSKQPNGDLSERLEKAAASIISSYPIVDELLKLHSNLDKIYRIIAYCLRFREPHQSAASSGFISPSEISRAVGVACRVVQIGAFPEEHSALSKGKPIKSSSRILSLSPFMDRDGIIRVGGRLKNSELQFDACHPNLLPRDHELTRRIIGREHARALHAGAQATMAAVRQQFWPLSLRSIT